MRVAIFTNHKYDQHSFEEANRSFNHDLVFLTATLDSATASLASGLPAVCVFVNDRLDAPAGQFVETIVAAGITLANTNLWR